ncbi:MAG: TRAP transporter large permease [Alphaproteobacteria bacterium]|nr:TRAP transporter large permease [Alphaproteobacteria bacterium]
MTAAIVGVFALTLASGMPIVFALGISAVVMLVLQGELLTIVPHTMYSALDSFPLMALPFFAISAHFMVKGGTSARLIAAASAWVGHLPGGLAIVTVLACMIFAALCGSSSATAVAIGSITVPAMIARGYERGFSAAVVGSAGTLGILIPPSVNFILYGIMAEESIGALFIAGVIPGIVLGLAFMACAVVISVRRGFGNAARAGWAERFQTSINALPALSLPVLILGSIYGGFATPTEAAALSVLYAILVGVFIYREIPLRSLVWEFGQAMKPAAMVMAIITTAVLFGHALTLGGVPQRVVGLVTHWELSAWMFLLAVNLLLIVMGMFLDVVSTMLISLPLLVPLLGPLGINKVHFGVVLVVNMEMALVTPPVGMNLFVVSATARAPMAEVVQASLPFLLANAIVLVLVTYVPEISLFLPRQAGLL